MRASSPTRRSFSLTTISAVVIVAMIRSTARGTRSAWRRHRGLGSSTRGPCARPLAPCRMGGEAPHHSGLAAVGVHHVGAERPQGRPEAGHGAGVGERPDRVHQRGHRPHLDPTRLDLVPERPSRSSIGAGQDRHVVARRLQTPCGVKTVSCAPPTSSLVMMWTIRTAQRPSAVSTLRIVRPMIRRSRARLWWRR